MDGEARAALAAAKARLDRLSLYPRPVSLRGVRVVVVPWLFRLPWFRRFDGYAAHRTILLRARGLLADGDLVTHELCHVWQMQHRPLRMPLAYLRAGYAGNPYEREAGSAVAMTRRPRMLVFLHGTAIMHAGAAGVAREERVAQVREGEASLRDFAGYVPTPGAVAAVRGWAERGAEIAYLSSHRDPRDVTVDEEVVRRHGFLPGPVLARAGGQSYGEAAAAAQPDVLVEDDCESIGSEAEMTSPQLPRALRERVCVLVVPEFGGLEGLPEEPWAT